MIIAIIKSQFKYLSANETKLQRGATAGLVIAQRGNVR